jgi:hypothetical protein
MVIQTDNAKEYVSAAFYSLCEDSKISLRQSASYLHENAAIAERIWRTLNNMSRAMLLTAELPSEFWALSVRHAVYIYNRLPHTHNKMKSPFLVLFNREPDLSSIRVFGCLAFAFIDSTLRTKLEPRGVAHRYIGHCTHSSSYRLLTMDFKFIVKSGMVKFVENLSSYGKLTLNPENFTDKLDTMYRTEAEDLSTLPTPFVKAQTVNFVTKIFNHRSWFDKNDNETYGLIFVSTRARTTPFWMYISVFFRSAEENFDRFEKYLKLQLARANGINVYYPLFAQVHVLFESVFHLAFITGTDANNKRHMYQVAFRDGLLDVGRSLIREFRDIAQTAIAAAVVTAISTYIDPLNYSQAMTYPDSAQWMDATNTEFNQILAMGVLSLLAVVPTGHNIVGTRFVYKLKRNADGSIDKYKARLVAQGYSQQHGVDYFSTHAPVTTIITTHLILILCVSWGLTPFHLDVTGAFLNAVLSETIYIRLPNGFSVNGRRFAKLNKSLYGLKQAARDWYMLSDTVIMAFDSRIRRSQIDPCFYYLISDSDIILINVHVDDYIFATNNKRRYQDFVKHMKTKFDVTDMGIVTQVAGVAIKWQKDRIELSQERDINDLLQKHQMMDSNVAKWPMVSKPGDFTPGEMNGDLPDVPYRSLLGSLMWLSGNTRPDIRAAVIIHASYTNCYTEAHWKSLKSILKYLKGTKHYHLCYTKPKEQASPFIETEIVQFCDSDWGENKLTRRSLSGALTLLYDNPIIITCIYQKVVAVSTSEAEYYAISEAIKDGKHVSGIMTEIGKVKKAILLHSDNLGACFMAENRVNNKRTRHIDIQYHFIREAVQAKQVCLVHCDGTKNWSDPLTKAQSTVEIFHYFVHWIMMKSTEKFK